MKKFFATLVHFFVIFNRNWNPRYLRWQNLALQAYIDKQATELSQVRRMHIPSEQTARAMLMQLRVHQESVRHRTGYMVSAFVPDGVVQQLRHLGADSQQQFASAVAESLVSNAISGIYKRSAATGKLTALIFEPITKRGQNVQLVGGIFETSQGPEVITMTDNPKYKQLTDVK